MKTFVLKTACFIELDAIRGMKKSISDAYIVRDGMRPAAPCDLGEQALVMPVVDYVKREVERYGHHVFLFDQASYIDDGVVPYDAYKAIMHETIMLLRENGIKVSDWATCRHAPKRQDVHDRVGNVIDTLTSPQCRCRFPNPEIFDKLVSLHDISRVTHEGNMQTLKSMAIAVSAEALEVLRLKVCVPKIVKLIAIMDGSIYNKELMTSAHVTAAAKVLDHQKKYVAEGGYTGEVTLTDMEALEGVFDSLPPELNKPAGAV